MPVPPKNARRGRGPLLVVIIVAALVASACGGGSDRTSGPTSTAPGATTYSGPTITVGAQNFPESAVLAHVYGQAFAARGYPVRYRPLAGARDAVYRAFAAGTIDFTPEYAASALEFLVKNAGEATPDVEQTTSALGDELRAKGLEPLAPSPARDNNSLVVTPATAAKFHLTKISDLAPLVGRLRFGGPPDCFTNPFCTKGLQERYGIDLRNHFTAFDFGGPKTKFALASGVIDVALLFSTDPSISGNHWRELEDDKGFINADNVVPVVRKPVADAYGKAFADVVNKVSASITTADLVAMNKRVQLDQQDPAVVAKDFLTAKHLLAS